MKNAVYLGFGVMQTHAQITYYGLHSLQHRGQEGTGIAVSDGKRVKAVRGEGLVTEIYTSEAMKELQGEGPRLVMSAIQLQEAAVMKMCSRLYSIFRPAVLLLPITGT